MSLLRTQLLRARPLQALPLACCSSSSFSHQSPFPLFHTSSRMQSYKDDQDRTSLKPRPSDSTMSGSDDEVAECPTAFDPNVTDPETEYQTCWKTPTDNPLDASGANREISKGTSERSEEKQLPREGKSGTGKCSKQGKKSGRMTSSFPK
ncbi:hypothetical protein QBC40DRAFT_264450 [Triangularia verruculosa]|uniref:Uncharacterized protein n=1 Tax=Triangularia verruculosa TaxID=2587418 RepID=A0AAN6XIT0_9PEZI|nr:hypothetical protein QBC40DRAFT_264450 [Triangularia verruculosa]